MEEERSRRPIIGGIFVGGESRRMGRAKGLLPSPEGPTLIDRAVSLLCAAGVRPVLVGVRPEYAHAGVLALADDPPGIGPLGGLVALLRHAGDGLALAIACDMPFVSAPLVERLAFAPARAPVLAARRDGRWEPLFARFDAPAVLSVAVAHAAAGRLALHALLDEVGVDPLAITADEARELDDWDTPGDVLRGKRPTT